MRIVCYTIECSWNQSWKHPAVFLIKVAAKQIGQWPSNPSNIGIPFLSSPCDPTQRQWFLSSKVMRQFWGEVGVDGFFLCFFWIETCSESLLIWVLDLAMNHQIRVDSVVGIGVSSAAFSTLRPLRQLLWVLRGHSGDISGYEAGLARGCQRWNPEPAPIMQYVCSSKLLSGTIWLHDF